MYFEVQGEPRGKARPRFTIKNGYVHAYTTDKTQICENNIALEYVTQCNRFKFDDKDELKMSVKAFFSVPKSESKKRKNLMLLGNIKPTKKPDFDNILKIVADSLNQIAYKDDAQIVEAYITKRYSDTPHICVTIETV